MSLSENSLFSFLSNTILTQPSECLYSPQGPMDSGDHFLYLVGVQSPVRSSGKIASTMIKDRDHTKYGIYTLKIKLLH